jgi:hypothetical protein
VNSAQALALAEAASLAGKLGRQLEPYDAIRQEDVGYWIDCAKRLRDVVSLASSALSSTEMSFHLKRQRDHFETLRQPI